MSGRYVDVTTQAELDAALKAGDIPECKGNGYFEVWDSSTVHAGDSSTVRAGGSSTVHAWGSSTVHAWGSSTVHAGDSSTVHAGDSSTVHASKYVGVTIHGVRTKVEGGVQIRIPTEFTAAEWCGFYGVEVNDGVATLFKAVDAAFKTHQNEFSYVPGSEPFAPDWDGGTRECGGGLHFSPRPSAALRFAGVVADVRFVACPVRVDEIFVHRKAQYPDKVKARRVCGPVWECDLDGNPVAIAAEASA